MTILLALLAVARLYHPETIDSLPCSRRTHVQVEGRVTLLRTEADGDLHIRLSDARGYFIVLEVIPEMSLPAPTLGSMIRAQGITRYDREHRWFELHPLESWALVAGPAARTRAPQSIPRASGRGASLSGCGASAPTGRSSRSPRHR
jgi:hypothetical protein